MMSLANEPDALGLEGTTELHGDLPGLGMFKLEVTTGPETNKAPAYGKPEAWADQPLDRTIYSSIHLPPQHTWKTKGNLTLGGSVKRMLNFL